MPTWHEHQGRTTHDGNAAHDVFPVVFEPASGGGEGAAGAGVDTIIQKATTGKVDWGQVAMSGALGGFGGASVAAKAGLTGLKGTVVAGAASGGVSGAASGAYEYMRGPGQHTVMGAVGATATGAGTGALLGAGGSAVGHGIAKKAGWIKDGDGIATGGIPLGGAKGVDIPTPSTALVRLGDIDTAPPIPHVRGEGVWVASTETVILNSNRARTEAMLDSSGLAREPARGQG